MEEIAKNLKPDWTIVDMETGQHEHTSCAVRVCYNWVNTHAKTKYRGWIFPEASPNTCISVCLETSAARRVGEGLGMVMG